MKLLDRLFGKEEGSSEGLPLFGFVEKKVDNEHVMVATQIQSGKYKGLIFSTGKVTLTPNEASETMELSYKYIIEFKPEGMSIDEDLNKVVGDIIMETLKKERLPEN